MRRLVVALGSAAFVGLLAAPAHAGSAAHAGSSAAAAPRPQVVVAVPAGGQAKALPATSGIAYLPGIVDLQPTASGTWVNTPLQVTLPRPGTYLLDANVQGRIWGNRPVNVVILARLFNVTTGTVVPNSVRLIDHLVDTDRGNATGIRATEPISEHTTVSAPTTIRLQVTRINQRGASTAAQICSDGDRGYTSLRFARV